MSDRMFSLYADNAGEKSKVSVLLAQSVFLGIFLGTFDVSAHSLFLAIFDEKMMARGYVVSGTAGIILTFIYSWFQNRMQFKKLGIINLVVITSITIILWVFLILSPSKWLVFIIFSMLGPLNLLAILGFRGTTNIFRLKHGDRLFVLVDSGMITGIIISCFAIPVLLFYNFALHNIFLLSASSVLFATIIQILIGARSNQSTESGKQQAEKNIEKKSFTGVFLKDSYTRIIVIFFSLSVVTAFFVQYSFMAVTRKQFPAEADMATFLGLFTGSMMIFTLLVKLFLFPYLIRNYGLRTCLTISPVLIAILTSVVITTGIITGYAQESSSGFFIFFLLLALSRFFSKSLQDSTEASSIKVLYQTIDEKIQYVVQSGMNSTVNEIAALSSGLILAGFGLLGFVKLTHFSWVLLFVVLLWVIVAFRLYSEFRKSIRKALEKAVNSIPKTSLKEQVIYKNRFSADISFRKDYFNLISGDYSVLKSNKNKPYFEKIIDYSASKQDINLLPVLKKIASDPDMELGICQRSAEVVELLQMLLYANQAEDRKISPARKILAETRQPQTTEILRLLRDKSIESKRLAIFMIGKFKLPDLLPEVCECMNIAGLETDAYEVLLSFGKSAVDELLRYYLVTSGNINISKSILRLLGKIKSEESIGFLFSRLSSKSRKLKELALRNLIDCEFKPAKEDKDRLHQFIAEILGIITWNLNAKICIEKNNDIFLLNIVNKENNRWTDFLFNVLSITYDSGSVNKIRENLNKDSVESLNNAFEMIDIIIDDSLKPKLICLLDTVPDEVRLKNLIKYFPVEIPDYNKLLEDIINRDYNLISLWTKACTLRNLLKIEGDDMTESVVALLFSPEDIIQEESAKLVARSSEELYKKVSYRLSDIIRKRLDKIVNGETDDMELIFEKARFLSDCFRGIPEDDLLSLAASLKFVRGIQSGSHPFAEGGIIWHLSADKLTKEVHVLYAKQLNEFFEKTDSNESTEYYVLPLDIINEYLLQFPENSIEILDYIDNYEE